MSVQVNTVLGPIDSSRLGVTLIHEHLKVALLGFEMDPFNTYDRTAALHDAVNNMKELRELGVSTVVDPLPMGLGRDPEFSAEVAEASGMQVIISTGVDHEFRAMPPYFKVRTTDEIAETYVSDLTQGIGSTGIKAGIIKVATGEGAITKNEGRAVRAAARAALKTNAPIVTHTTHGTMGVEQAEMFMGEGLSPGKFMIGHCCQSTDLPYLRRILDTGCFMGFDQIGLNYLQNDDNRLAMLSALLALGHADRLLLSQDHMCCIIGAPYERVAYMMDMIREHRHSYLLREFLPRLREARVPDAMIDEMMAKNPRRLYENPAKAEAGS